jgi:hypothetical protein
MSSENNKASGAAPEILIYCGNGFVFEEMFRRIIRDMGAACKISLLLNEFYIAGHTLELINKMVSEKLIASYQFVPDLNDKKSAFLYHKKVNSVIRSLNTKKIDMLISLSECYPLERYLIKLVKSQGGITVIPWSGTLWIMLNEYRRMAGISAEAKPQALIKRIIDKPAAILIKKVISRSKKLGSLAVTKIEVFKNHYLFPFIFKRCFFPVSKYDKFLISAGRVDAVIFYDDLEVDALRRVVPPVKNIYISKHPAAGLCRCQDNNVPKTKLLAAFAGNLRSELPEEKLQRWGSVIKQAVNLKGIKEGDIRVHPCTSKDVRWPHRLSDMLKLEGCKVKIIDSMQVSLVNTVCDYAGIIGAPSGSLRVARAVCKNLFIVGIANMQEGYLDDQEWILGRGEGINWLGDGENLQAKHLEVKNNAADSRPYISELLISLLNDHRRGLTGTQLI